MFASVFITKLFRATPYDGKIALVFRGIHEKKARKNPNSKVKMIKTLKPTRQNPIRIKFNGITYCTQSD